MRITMFTPSGSHEKLLGEVSSDEVVTFAEVHTVADFLSEAERPDANGRRFPLAEVTPLPLVAPRSVFGVALNYRAHIEESGMETPSEPEVFTKGASAITAPNGQIRRGASNQLDYEGELAVVIGKDGAVGGLAVANDVSARDWQSGDGQWWRAKGSDGFCPLGPWITTVDEVSDVSNLQLRTWVNDELRQDANTGDLLYGVAELIEWISVSVTLTAGDVILTGTPGGVAAGMESPKWLQPGDRVKVEVSELGTIENEVVA